VIENIVNKLVYEDIANYYNIQTTNISLFLQILTFIANSAPSILNYSSIAKHIGSTSDTVKYYTEILKEIGLLHII
jgi:predicted AAA+ superfamily ATPase